MDACLNQTVGISLPVWNTYSRVPKIPGYTNISTKVPILERLLGTLPATEGQLQSDEFFARVHSFDGSGECIVETASKKKKHAYCKVTHILDPVRKIQGYYDDVEKGAERAERKRSYTTNQAYIDFLANYLLGQLRERNISPHFCMFYGGFQGIADTYRYNITESFESYRHYKRFWDKKDSGLFKLYITHDGETVDEEDIQARSTVHTRSFSYSTDKTDSSHISLLEYAGTDESLDELESVNSFPSNSSDSEEDSDYDSDEESTHVFSEFSKFPTMLIFQEKMNGIMDKELDVVDDSFEEKWTAWTFQVIAALCVAQGVFGLTHNDLHTNNILYSNTDIEFLYYTMRNGSTWKVPTYGRILRIIDFGRAVFRVNETWFVSDDFAKGGDAQAQYSFGEFKVGDSPEIYPNPSFDLSRYAVSVIEALFTNIPADKEDGAILSQEGSWIVRETVSPLWNLLWSWLVDSEGKNVLREEDGTERYPNFDLYERIASHIMNARPCDQVTKDIFKGYSISRTDVPEKENVYSLFC